MLDPKQHEIIAQTPGQLKKIRDPFYAIVFPNGMVKEIECGRNSAHRGGLTILEFRDGRPVIKPRYQDQGFEFYQKMCERLGETDKWDLWCEMIQSRNRGVYVKFPEECFCSEVIHRRKVARGEAPGATIDFAERQKEIEKNAKERGKKSIKDRLEGGLRDDLEGLEKSTSKA